MKGDRANWDDSTISLFLDLVIQQKNLYHWNDKTLTSLGWANVHRAFNKAMMFGYHKKQL
jgi:hypothetical protein